MTNNIDFGEFLDLFMCQTDILDIWSNVHEKDGLRQEYHSTIFMDTKHGLRDRQSLIQYIISLTRSRCIEEVAINQFTPIEFRHLAVVVSNRKEEYI